MTTLDPVTCSALPAPTTSSVWDIIRGYSPGSVVAPSATLLLHKAALIIIPFCRRARLL